MEPWSEKENTLGFYSPNHKYLTLYDYGGDDTVAGITKETIQTALHEVWHQFFDVLTAQQPIWLNEGIAEFVGHCDIPRDGSKVNVGLLIRKQGDDFMTRYQVLKSLDKYYRLNDLFRMTTAEWHKSDKNVLYAQSWSVVYYAMKGGNDAFKKDFQKFFKDLRDGRPWLDAVEQHFPEKKLDALEKQWLKFIREL